MRLHSLRIEPLGDAGWASDTLLFGKEITELFGPNGCGKTPVLQSIAFALGYPVKFRDDIYQNCASVLLTIESELGPIRLRRAISTDFDNEVQVGTSAPRRFYTELEFGKFLLELFGFESPTLTSTSGDPTFAYMSTLLPIFYLDQDHGYSSAYRSPSTFIKDQYVEMMRLTLGLPPKHSFEQKKTVLRKKQELDQLDHAIVVRRTLLESLTKELKTQRRPLDDVDLDLTEVKEQLQSLKSTRSAKFDASFAIDNVINERVSKQRNLTAEIRDLKARVSGFGRIQHEIEIEINTLSLNEEAKRLFTSFEDICANPNCGLFLGSSEAYGKNLLYLRDQIKDLQRNNAIQESRIAALAVESETVSKEIQSWEAKRTAMVAADEHEALVEAIGELTRRLFDLQTEKESLRKLSDDEHAFVQLLNEREHLQNQLASMGGTVGDSDLQAIELRNRWKERVIYWLDALRTMNVSRDLYIDSDFGLQFGTEKMSQFKGSTLTRVILAIRTATIELYTTDPTSKMRFFILDTPRQQDIDREDLAHYVSQLKALCSRNLVQVVFSTTNYHYPVSANDAEWAPRFPGENQNMFLGPPSETGVVP